MKHLFWMFLVLVAIILGCGYLASNSRQLMVRNNELDAENKRLKAQVADLSKQRDEAESLLKSYQEETLKLSRQTQELQAQIALYKGEWAITLSQAISCKDKLKEIQLQMPGDPAVPPRGGSANTGGLVAQNKEAELLASFTAFDVRNAIYAGMVSLVSVLMTVLVCGKPRPR